jgi:hypothetical protein
MVTKYRLNDQRILVRLPERAKDSSSIHNGETGSRAQPISCLVGTWVESYRNVKFTIYLNLVPGLRMHEAITNPTFPYAFVT